MTLRDKALPLLHDPVASSAQTDDATSEQDFLLTVGRALLYPGLALTSLLVLRGPGELPIGDMMVAGAGLCALMSIRKPESKLPAVLWLAGALLAIGATMSSAASADPAGSLTVAGRILYMIVFVPWILSTLLVSRRHFVRAVLWWLGGAAVCALGAVAQMLWGDVIPGGDVTADSRFTGFTTHPSDLAGICAMASAAAIAAIGPKLPRTARYSALVILIVCTVGLVLSGSVSGLLGMTAAVMFLVARGAVHIRRGLVVGAAAALVLNVALSQLEALGALDPVERLMRTTGLTATNAEYETASTRVELLRRAVAEIAESPIVGHGMLVEDNVLFKRFTVHNNFLAAWMSGGVLAFAAVAMVSYLALRYCLRRRPADPMHIVVATSFMAALVFAQTAPGMYNRYYWLPVAFAIYLAYRSEPEVARPSPGVLPGAS